MVVLLMKLVDQTKSIKSVADVVCGAHCTSSAQATHATYAHSPACSFFNCFPPPPLTHLDDPRRPFPQDIEMRSGYLGWLTSGFQPVQPPAAASTTGEGDKPPPEKRIALNAIPGSVFAGVYIIVLVHCMCVTGVCVYHPNTALCYLPSKQ